MGRFSSLTAATIAGALHRLGPAAVSSLFLVTACHPAANPKPKASPTPEIQGYRDIKFGNTFREVMGTVPTGTFDSYSVKDCLDNLPLRGCGLSGVGDGYHDFTVVDGIPYSLNVVFNRHDTATDIVLIYKKDHEISRAECADVHIRTFNWLLKQYGTFAQDRDNVHLIFRGAVTDGQKKQVLVSAGANSFFSGYARTVSTTPDWRKPITQWDKSRYVDLLGYYFDIGDGICTVEVGFREPASVERPPIPAATATPTAKATVSRTTTAENDQEDDPDYVNEIDE